MENGFRSVYIVLTQPHSIVAKILRLFSGHPYNHASVSFCDDLKQMYSFGRLHIRMPIIGGFVEESCDKGFFKQHDYTSCMVYEIKVTDNQYEKCLETLDAFKSNSKKYKYNHLGLLTIPLHIPFAMTNRFVCSQFVAYLLGNSNAVYFPKDFTLVTPWDLAEISGAKLIYQGNLRFFKYAMGYGLKA